MKTYISKNLKYFGLTVLTLTFITACSGTRPNQLGVNSGKLQGCPNSPNCVSSFANDEKHKIEPYSFNISTETILTRLKEILKKDGKAKIITEETNYIYAEFTSSVFQFVDDVEFLIDPKESKLYFRSASRVGYSDLGVNRDRIESILKSLKNQTIPK